MSPEYLAPGVYVEEVPFASHPIEGVSTRPGNDTLVLPSKAWAELRKMAVKLRKRCPHCRALVMGADPGARLFAVRALALELGLRMYRINLAEVISKYVGETEKSLKRLFQAAEKGSAILFFDEAEALFGKRTEVKDSHDRYANSKRDHLAQRIEESAGVVVFGVTEEAKLDPGVVSRFQFVVAIDRKQRRRSVPPRRGNRATVFLQ